MFISSVTIDYEGKGLRDVKVKSWSDVESAIQTVDGTQCSNIRLNGPNDRFMGIGGGKNGNFVCFVIDENGAETWVIDPTEDSDENIEIYMGQVNIRSKNEIVNLESVLAVAKTYSENGGLNENHVWQS